MPFLIEMAYYLFPSQRSIEIYGLWFRLRAFSLWQIKIDNKVEMRDLPGGCNTIAKQLYIPDKMLIQSQIDLLFDRAISFSGNQKIISENGIARFAWGML